MAIDPFTAVQVGTSLLGGIFGSSAAKKQAKRAKQIGEYNAKVAQIQSEAEQASIDFQSRQLVKQQREIKAQQRMSIAGRGGLETGTDLLSLIESAKNMQLDLLELERQQDIARISGETQAQMARMGAEAQASAYKAQGRQAMIGGVLGAARSVAPMFTKTPQPAKPNYLAMNTRTPFGGSSFNLSGDMYT
tara:strand:- start:97 stop:669 length:573 start_codon:yes stop_codon:yes gene_type:complete